MKITFDDILNRMKNAFFNECEKNPESLGDINARLNVVASEIYSLCCNMDYVTKQAFVQTAFGEYLDYHAELRNMSRKAASKAVGELKFSIPELLDEDILIPKGTICSVKDKPFIQFATDEDAVLRARSYFVKVPATALDVGTSYNVEPNMITVLVNAPARIEEVTNDNHFVGGNDVESDERLRSRLLNSFKQLPNGVNKQSVEDSVRSIDEVLDCHIYALDSSSKAVNVCVRTIFGGLDYNIISKVQNKLLALNMLGVSANIKNAHEKYVRISIVTNADGDKVSDACATFFDTLKIGERVDLLKLRIWLMKNMDDDIVDIRCADSVGNYITCDNGEILILNGVEVIPYE